MTVGYHAVAGVEEFVHFVDTFRVVAFEAGYASGKEADFEADHWAGEVWEDVGICFVAEIGGIEVSTGDFV